MLKYKKFYCLLIFRPPPHLDPLVYVCMARQSFTVLVQYYNNNIQDLISIQNKLNKCINS
jgi:hypothetical protein